MGFLQSVIADARPRKSMPNQSHGPLTTTEWNNRTPDGAASAIEAIPSGPVEQSSHSSVSLPIRDRTNEFTVGDNSVPIQKHNPVNQGGLGVENNVEPESPLSVAVDMPEPIPVGESYSRVDIGNLSDREPGSEGGKTYNAEESMTRQPAGTVVQEGRTIPSTSQSSDFSIEFQDRHQLQNQTNDNEEIEPVSSPASITETPIIQTDATQTTDLTSSKVSHRIESGTLEASLVPVAPSPSESGDQGLDTASAAGPPGAVAEGDFQQPGQLRVDDAPSPVSEHSLRPDNRAQRNETGKALADGGKAAKISPGVDERADIESLSSREVTPRHQNPGETKEVPQDIQSVSQKQNDFVPQTTKDIEQASVPQQAGKKVSDSVSSPNYLSTKPGSLEQHLARTAKPSVGSDVLRSVPAMPLNTDSMSKAGATLGSRLPPRYAEKKHEAPKVQIGRLDVIIEAAAQPVSKPATSSLPNDMASRYYLRRL